MSAVDVYRLVRAEAVYGLCVVGLRQFYRVNLVEQRADGCDSVPFEGAGLNEGGEWESLPQALHKRGIDRKADGSYYVTPSSRRSCRLGRRHSIDTCNGFKSTLKDWYRPLALDWTKTVEKLTVDAGRRDCLRVSNVSFTNSSAVSCVHAAQPPRFELFLADDERYRGRRDSECVRIPLLKALGVGH
jgi:hypothetical protein